MSTTVSFNFMKRLLFIGLLSASAAALFARQASPSNEAVFLQRAQQALTSVLITDQFSLPVCIRIYTYSNIAAYEALATGNQQFSSLHKSDKRFPDLSSITPPKNVHLPLAAVYAYLLTGKNFVYHEQQLNDSLIRILQDFRLPGSDYTVVQASLDYGTKVAEAVYNWTKSDNYRQIRSFPTYVELNKPGKWTPTPPFRLSAQEAWWGRMRCLVMDSASQFHPGEPLRYDENNNSEFYNESKQVYQAVKNITAADKATISYWNEAYNIATKWLTIAAGVSAQHHADMYTTSRTFTMTCLALYDGIISCWNEKYRSNFLRPESFIRSKIDKAWNPYLKSPPTPEFTSHTAVLSEAVALVLSSLYGKETPFTDLPEKQQTPRTFSSFQQAAGEASNTDMISGVSFPRSIKSGREQGFQVGSLVVKKHTLNQIARK